MFGRVFLNLGDGIKILRIYMFIHRDKWGTGMIHNNSMEAFCPATSSQKASARLPRALISNLMSSVPVKCLAFLVNPPFFGWTFPIHSMGWFKGTSKRKKPYIFPVNIGFPVNLPLKQRMMPNEMPPLFRCPLSMQNWFKSWLKASFGLSQIKESIVPCCSA